MTTQQGKELSSEASTVYTVSLQRAIEHHCRGLAVPRHIAAECPFHAKLLDAKLLSTSPQLPVAEQPAGQAAKPVAWMWSYRGLLRVTTDSEEAIACGSELTPLYAAPHSPVAQMSGDATLRERYTQWAEVFYRNADSFTQRDYVIGWNAWLAASHPSNAAGQDAPEEDAADDWRRLALQFDNHRMQAIWHLKRRLGNPQESEAATAAREFLASGPLDGEAVLAERIAAIAATVQPVVQAPDGWKLVPIEPTEEMQSAGCKAIGRIDTRWETPPMDDVWADMLDAAPQPIAASPSIVPSDEQIANRAVAICDLMIATSPRKQYREAAEMIKARLLNQTALTTASNAGEAVKGGEA